MKPRLIELLTLAAIMALVGVVPAQTPLDSAFAYQGQIKKDGIPVTGSCDFTFTLFDANTGGSQVGGTRNLTAVTVNNGLFTVALDFGAVFTGDKRWLEIQARCPAGSGTVATLSPRQELTGSPHAAYALNAGFAAASASMPWSGVTGVPTGFADGVDNDTQYTAGTGLSLSSGQFSINTGAIQQRVAGTCAAGSSIRVINLDGTVTCQTDANSGGTVTGVTAGTGLTGGGTTGVVSLAVSFGTAATQAAAGNHAHDRILADANGSLRVVSTGASTTPNIIGGYSGNAVDSGKGATIGGGGSSGTTCGLSGNQPCSNRVAGDYAAVGGGWSNTSSGAAATVGGGDANTAGGNFATVGGGHSNTASSDLATVGGGYGNTAIHYSATVGGGWLNTASGETATVGGGGNNTASGNWATIPGGRQNVAQGQYSFAAGYRAKTAAAAAGSFVWSDGNEFDTVSWGPNEFVARATGGFWFITGVDPATGNVATGLRLPAGQSAWASISDRNVKTDVTPVDAREVVAKLVQIPLATWRYKAQAEGIRHMGPMAQDFYAAFGLGEDDKYISTIDADGVALAAIQGLYQELKDRDAKIATLEARLIEVERVLQHLVAAAAEKR